MTTFLRIIKSGFVNFFRNGWLSLASITIMILTLLTIAVFLVLNMVLTAGIKEVQDKMDVSVYFNSETKEEQIAKVQEIMSEMPEVKEITYVSKEEAMDRLKKSFGDNEKILDPLEGDNPLPASLGIKVYEVDDFDIVALKLEDEEVKPLIHNVSYKQNEKIIKRLFTATDIIQKIGLGLATVFIISSLIIIFNTVRMAIFARQEELEIMQLVGANRWFSEGPFIVEGIIVGLIATAITQAIIIPTITYVTPMIDNYIGGGFSTEISSYLNANIMQIVGIELGVAVAIGVLSSYFAVRKYLKKTYPTK